MRTNVSTSSTSSAPAWPLRLAQLGWPLTAALALLLFLASLPIHFDQLANFEPATLPEGWSAAAWQAALTQIGLPPARYAAARVSFDSLFVLAFYIQAAILWRRAHERMALFAAYFMALFSVYWVIDAEWMPPALLPVLQVLTFAALTLLVLFFLLFPDGHFVPRWSRWLALIWSALGALQLFWPQPLAFLNQATFYAMLATAAVAQIYRYGHTATPLGRQQTKWVALGFAIALVALLALLLAGLTWPELNQPGTPGLVYWLTGLGLSHLLLLLLPMSMALAILRYRLWDIDVIIRRSLLYSLLTALLGLAYFGSVLVLENVARPLTGTGESQWAVVVSTLGIAALFVPLRARLQEVIDRRFYRKKYDASKTMAAFGLTLRDEVDLDRLTNDLLQTAEATMQPAQLGLWLPPPVDQSPLLREPEHSLEN